MRLFFLHIDHMLGGPMSFREASLPFLFPLKVAMQCKNVCSKQAKRRHWDAKYILQSILSPFNDGPFHLNEAGIRFVEKIIIRRSVKKPRNLYTTNVFHFIKSTLQWVYIKGFSQSFTKHNWEKIHTTFENKLKSMRIKF